jgi:CBS-domain-containing membrane protein
VHACVRVHVQTSVIELLATVLADLPEAGLSLARLGLLHDRPLVTAASSDRVLDVVHLLHAHSVTALPIVTPDGRLDGVFSVADVRRIITYPKVFWTLFATVADYRAATTTFASLVGWVRKHVASPAWDHITGAAPLEEVVQVLTKLHIHRVVVTDAEHVPVCVVSVGDIISALVQEPEGYSPPGATGATAATSAVSA